MESYTESQKHLARPYRKAVLKTLLILTAVSGLLFFMLNMQRGNYPLAFAEIGMACYSVFIFWQSETPNTWNDGSWRLSCPFASP